LAGVIYIEAAKRDVDYPESRTWSMTVNKTGISIKETSILKSIADQGSGQFEAIFLENWPRVYGLLLRLVGDPDEAEDLALETFLRLYRHPVADHQDTNLGGWLHRVAVNLGLNSLRNWQRRRRYEEKAGKLDLIENSPVNPADIFTIKEQHRNTREILAEMNPRQSQILILRYSGLAYREIAVIMGLAPSSIGPLLARAEKEFEKRFRAKEPEGEP
jgi:RNA polymerase sigma-70 factor (ECF subfamily)